MNTYLGYIQAVANRLPTESLTDLAINSMNSKKWIENPPSVIFSKFNDLSIDFVVQIVFRTLCAHFIYPQASSIICRINVSIGIIHLGTGFIQRFRPNPDWRPIARNVHIGFVYFLIAGYDFGVGFLLKQRYFALASVAAFLIAPVAALSLHQRIFKKPDVIQPLLQVEQLNPQSVQSLLVVEPKNQNEQLPEEVVPTYLDKTCLIYIIAEKITCELIPNVKL